MYHNPVLLSESVLGLAIKPNGTYVDLTFGGGGHSAEILKHLPDGKLIAFDQDDDAERNLPDDKRIIFANNNFKYLKNFLKFYKAIPVDGIIADLGVSSFQFDNPERGFSIRFEGDLDLRMDRKNKIDAKNILNEYTKERLRDIFFKFGEIHNSSKLASLIVEKRKDEKIASITKFKELISTCIPKEKENKYLAKVFQALRIEVNDELDSLQEMLPQSRDVLRSGGRFVVISYHSLEDRLIKNFFRSGNLEGKIEKDFFGVPQTPFKLITKRPIIAGEKEIEENSRARSAKLRIAEKI